MNSISILDRLISFPTISRDGNLELIDFIGNYLEDFDIEPTLVHNSTRTKANLYATVGPADRPGVLLSGHTDVVPVDGQAWTTDPFKMANAQGRLFGRGTCDMKGFIACVLALIGRTQADSLQTPLHLAFSYDEEIGCIGVRRLIETLSNHPVIPRYCIVGEPTSMQMVVAHKGKTAGLVTCNGHECHSSLAPDGLNAIYLANGMISAIMKLQKEIEYRGGKDTAYEVAYTTLHVGVITGGTALNIVPNECQFEFEIRHLPEDSPEHLLRKLEHAAEEVMSHHRENFPEAGISIDVTNSYPALNTPEDSSVVDFVRSLTGTNSCGKITFGTEGGLFSDRLGIETLVLGPGNIAQAHKPDEFIELRQLQLCDQFLDRLAHALTS